MQRYRPVSRRVVDTIKKLVAAGTSPSVTFVRDIFWELLLIFIRMENIKSKLNKHELW